MNYGVLKSILDILVKTYKCPHCSSPVEEKNVDIVGAAGSQINVDIECTVCKKHSMVKAEVSPMNISNMSITPDSINELKEKLSSSSVVDISENSNAVKDTDIVELNKKLKTSENIGDLFKD